MGVTKTVLFVYIVHNGSKTVLGNIGQVEILTYRRALFRVVASDKVDGD